MKHLKSFKIFKENYVDANNKICDFQDGDKVKTDSGTIGNVSRIENSTEDNKKVTKALVKFTKNGMTSSGMYPIEKLSKA